MNALLRSLSASLLTAPKRCSHWIARQAVAIRSRRCRLDEVGRVVVYTAIFGGKDELREAPPFPGVDYVCFTDDRRLHSNTWRIVVVDDDTEDPRMRAKIYKILPHRYFPGHKYSLWVDGTHILRVDPRYLVRRHLPKNDIALFQHPQRRCIYEEMELCLRYNKGNAEDIRRQRKQYLSDGYPRDNGLAACTVILRRHHANHVKQAMEEWWEQINRYSARDQLSFNYVAHRQGLDYSVIRGDVFSNFYFQTIEHRRPDMKVLSVGWILNGQRENSSTRIMGENVHEYLVSKGVFSKILFRPKQRFITRLRLPRRPRDEAFRHNINVLVIVKLTGGYTMDRVLERAKGLDIKVVYVVCDLPSKKMLAAADAIIATSEEYRSIIPPEHLHKLHIAFDGYEHDGSRKKVHDGHRTLKLCMVTNRVWRRVPCIPELPENVSLKVIGPGPEILINPIRRARVFRGGGFPVDYVPWREKTVIEEILECDAGIIPWPAIGEAERIKSANRLVLFMSLGLPVIASPVLSYLPIVRHGENGFIAGEPAEWLEYISLLRDDPARRRAIGEAARNDVVGRYSKKEQGELYRRILTGILEGQESPARLSESGRVG